MQNWEQHWGRRYKPETKYDTIGYQLEQLDQEGKIGPVVVDVGSGDWSMASDLIFNHKIIEINIGDSTVKQGPYTLRLPADIEAVGDGSPATTRNLIKIAKFLEIDPHSEAEQVDFFISSDVLNYIDYRKVLPELFRYLKPGGRILILNMPGRGFGSLMPDTGVKDNHELLQLLTDSGLVIETLIQDGRVTDPEDLETKSMIRI